MFKRVDEKRKGENVARGDHRRNVDGGFKGAVDHPLGHPLGGFKLSPLKKRTSVIGLDADLTLIFSFTSSANLAAPWLQ